MEIRFDAIPQQVLSHLRGGENDTLMHKFEDERVKVMLVTLEPGSSIGMHRHEGSCEVYYGLAGSGKVLYDDAEEPMSPGRCHYCPEGHSHSLINNGSEPLTVFAMVPKFPE